jgi:hypothetical protein
MQVSPVTQPPPQTAAFPNKLPAFVRAVTVCQFSPGFPASSGEEGDAMTKTARNVMVGMAIAMGAAGIPRAEAGNGGTGTVDPTALVRIRTPNPTLAALIQEATERSTTFRGLVDAINGSDGIVYVNEGKCGHGVHACLAGVTAAGENRIFQVRVDTRKADWDLMGSIGHELRHVVEVLGDRTVTNTNAMFLFYLRTGRTGTASSFETLAAVDAGHAVRSEVRRVSR